MNILLEFALSLGAALLLTPLIRTLAVATECFDRPCRRKVHVAPTPLLGGLAIYLSILAGWWMSAEWLRSGNPWAYPAPVVMGTAAALTMVGLLDDCVNLRWWFKFVLQIGMACLLFHCGVKVQLHWLPEWANFLLTMFWIVGITNAINFLDNMNGLAAGLGAIAAGYFTLLGIWYEPRLVAGIAAAITGASLGFLRYNYRRASIFMGDAGSLSLGLLLAAAGILLRFPGRANWITWMTPVIILLVPVFDMTLVCFSRLRQGRNPLATPGQDHVSHRLVRLGFTPVQSVDIIYGVALLCGAIGTVVTVLPLTWAYVSLGILILLFIGGFCYLTIKAPVTYDSPVTPPQKNET